MTAVAARASALENEIVVLDIDPSRFWFGACRNVNLFVWTQTGTLDSYKRIERTNPKRTQAHPEKLTTVHIVLPSAGPPDSETREAFNAMHAKWQHTVGCAALVLERGGFLGVAVRSAIAGMVMVAPKHFRIKVFDAIDHASPWLSEHHGKSTGAEWTAEEWLAVLRAARKAGGGD